MSEIDKLPIAQEIKRYINARRDDKEQKLLKLKPSKTGKGGINIKLLELADQLAKENKDIEATVKAIKKAKKPKDLTILAFEQDKYIKLLALVAEKAHEVKGEYDEALTIINQKHHIVTWLDWAAEKAKGVSLDTTHVIKLTNAGISGATNIYDKTTSINPRYLTTSSLDNPAIDGAYSNSTLAPIITLLQLSHHNKTLADNILKNDVSSLSVFSDNDEQIKMWMTGFKKAMESSQKKSHYLAKQVYFPHNADGYHLLLPVISSSLAHALYEKFQEYFSEQQKKTRRSRKEGCYSTKIATNYPNKAIIRVTASQHQNVSPLNSKRKGQLVLLSCQPPQWKSQFKPPLTVSSLFEADINSIARKNIKQLQKFLLLVKKKDLNPSDPKLHEYLLNLVDRIIDDLFNYVAGLDQPEKAGWSEDSILTLSHQLWLDPLKNDDFFQQQRQSKGWKEEIHEDFSLWLNKKLEHKKMLLGTVHEAFWRKIIKQRFREFEAIRAVQS